MSDSIEALRQRLDEIDAEIVSRLADRQDVVGEIGQCKVTGTDPLRDLAREEDLLSRVTELARETGLDSYYVTRLFREILDHSVRRQQEHLLDTQDPDRHGADTVVVGYHGTEGAYSHLAALKHFASREANLHFKGHDSFRKMLEALGEGGVRYAVLPIENTTAGSINEAYDLLARMNLALVGEEVVKVDHCLLALEPVSISRIRRVYSHPQALDQCSEFLHTLADCQVQSFSDTATAARRLREHQDLSEAAIASEEAARRYGLTILKRSIANQKQNFTRFVIVARDSVRVDARIPCKTSLVLATRHEEGALLACLNVLATHHLNLTKLESRPRPNTPWEYLFYIDFDGNLADDNVEQAVRELASQTSFLKVLGSYPARVTKDAPVAEPRPVVPAAASARRQPEQPPAGPAPSVLQTLEKKPYKLVSRANRPADTIVKVGSVRFGGERPVVIAGPCSVESREQVMACARQVHEAGGQVLRGGCFKPRTSPYSFQGMGYDGLDLLEEAGRAYGLPIVTEVLHPSDVERVSVKADILQVGARNMQNFSLLKEVGHVDRPVLLKRGMMASIDEWLAAAEYILAHGNQQVILCERGIRTFETATRSTLDLSAVPVVRERTHLPIIVDPSHACGTWRWIADMTAAALACRAHGVMVEIHPDPDKALSDGPQSLNFDRFAELMQKVHRIANSE